MLQFTITDNRSKWSVNSKPDFYYTRSLYTPIFYIHIYKVRYTSYLATIYLVLYINLGFQIPVGI